VNVDASVTTALATLLGAATGGLTSVLATLLTQRTQARAQWFEQEALRRRDLCKEFIETAARCYVHALQNEEADIPGLVDLYAKIDRMLHPVFGQGRRHRRTLRTKDRRHLLGTEQELR
jgi:hypothetical protein